MKSGRSSPSAYFAVLFGRLDYLWFSGLVVAILCLGGLVVPGSAKQRDWAEYLLAGLTAAATIGAALLLRGRTLPSGTLRFAKVALVTLCILMPLNVVVASLVRLPIVCAVAQLAVLLIANDILRRRTGGEEGVPAYAVVAAFPLFAAAWCAAVGLIWWRDPDRWAAGSLPCVIVLILSFAWTFRTLYSAPSPHETRSIHATQSLYIGLAIVSILVLAAFSFGARNLFDGVAYHHWSVYIGPVLLVRQGGWLLWDVPSQYGFLSTLSIVIMPFRSAWQSMYVLSSLLQFASACFVFYVLARLRRGPQHLLFSLALTVAVVFLVPGKVDILGGPYATPSVGGIRFIWCHALIGLLLLQWRRSESRGADPRLLAAGTLVWLLGVLWSAESAVYCSLTWLPAYALILWQQRKSGALTLGWAALYLAMPVALALGAVLAIASIYKIGLGHGPDWRAYADYALAFRSGFGSISVDDLGPAWILIIAFCVVGTLVIDIARDPERRRQLPLVVGILGALWATGSYFMGRSHPNNIFNLAPMVCVVLAIALSLARSQRRLPGWYGIAVACLLPVLTIYMTAAYGRPGRLAGYVKDLGRGYVANVEYGMPKRDPLLDGVLTSAHVRPEDPLVYLGMNLMLADSAAEPHRAWLPIEPYGGVKPLSVSRLSVYASRFVQRHGSRGGWLIRDKSLIDLDPSFGSTILAGYDKGAAFENERFVAARLTPQHSGANPGRIVARGSALSDGR